MSVCECGCGEPTKLITKTQADRGYVKGEYRRFLPGHNRRPEHEYLEEDHGFETPCWIWQRKKNPQGYGLAYLGDDHWTTAQRVYYERFVGPIPESLQIDHLCRVPACVNPAHLEAVTQAENIRRGANAKLTAADVEDIRERFSVGDAVKKIAADYGVTLSLIYQIRRGEAWSR